MAPFFLSLATRLGERSTLCLATLPPGKNPHYALNRRLGGLQTQPGHFGGKIISSPCPVSNPRSPHL